MAAATPDIKLNLKEEKKDDFNWICALFKLTKVASYGHG